MAIQFCTHQFEAAHGKRPSGRGSWAFFFNGATRVEDAFWYNGLYSDARKAALAEAKKRGAVEIEVGS
jgi:hypothetical protein